MILGIIALFLAIAVATPIIFFALVKFVGKYFSLGINKNSWLGKKI